MKKELCIKGMSCQHCVASIEKGLMEVVGMDKVKVNLKKEKAVVKYQEDSVTIEGILQKINELGFQAEVI